MPASSSEFGLLAWLQNTRVTLPLKGVECRFQITGAVASVELDQIYLQNTDRPLDCTYTFPLPAGAAVYRCELHINGRVIRAKVEEQAAARRIFREQTAAGRRAALVETERENLFTLSLGNVQPEDVIVVRFAWFQILDRIGDGLRLLVPTCPGVRYIPGKPLLRALSGRGVADDTDQVPDASRITPPRIDALHPDAAYFSLEGRLSELAGGSASSPSHPIYVRESEGAATIELSGRGAVPDRDFVLAWREPLTAQLAPQAWHWTEGAETYALVQLRAPKEVKVAGAFAQDFYFLVDRSGSMAGAKWQRTCQALHAFVGLLGASDRLWITLFESDFRDFAEAPMPAPAVQEDRGFQGMESLGVCGGTELLPAARHVLEQISIHSRKNRACVVLITDGQVGNDLEMVQLFKQAPRVTVHTFGIDTAVNDAFLKTLARQQRGGCWLQTPDDDIAGTIAALGDRLRRPVLTDLAVRGSWEAGHETWPDLHAQEVVTIALRGDAASPLEVTGCWPDGREHRFAVDLGAVGSEAVKLLWAKERMTALLNAERPQEAIALARQHNLICEGTAFIAWDEAEQVQIAMQELIQPALEPHFMLAAAALQSPMMSRRATRDIGCSSVFNEWVADSNEATPYEPDLDLLLREPLEDLRLSEQSIQAWMKWVLCQVNPSARMHDLRQAAELVTRVRNEFAPILQARVEQLIGSALNSPEALLEWEKECRPAFDQLVELRIKLAASGATAKVIDQLVAWVVESGAFDRDRLAQLETFADSLRRVPFSAGAKERLLQTFLDSTLGAGSQV